MNEIYNPNPTILKTAGKRGTRASSNLWDLDEGQTDGYGDHSVSESMDQNEIFGRHPSPSIAVSQLRPHSPHRSGQVHHRPGAQAHDTGGTDGRLCPAMQYLE